jgi:hypothetical protein
MNEKPRQHPKAWKPAKAPIWQLKENENTEFQLLYYQAVALLSDLKIAQRSPRYPSELNLVEINLNNFVTGVMAIIAAPKRAPKGRKELRETYNSAVLTLDTLPETKGFSLSDLVRDTPELGVA